jgi:hypothetical protein
VAKILETQTTAGTWAAAITQIDQAPFVIPSCAFSVSRDTDQTITDNSATKVLFDAEQYDYDATFDLVTNDRHQPNVAGVYHYDFGHMWKSTSNTNYASYGAIWKTGAEEKRTQYLIPTSGGVDGRAMSADIVMNGADDYVEFYVYQNGASGSDDLFGGATFCWANGRRAGT